MADETPGAGNGADGQGGAPDPALAGQGGQTGGVPPERPWYERRIDEVTANWRQEQRSHAETAQRAKTAEDALEAAKKGGATIPPPAPGSPEFERAVRERAV